MGLTQKYNIKFCNCEFVTCNLIVIKKVDAEIFPGNSFTSRPNTVMTKESVFAEHSIIVLYSVWAVRHKMYSCLAIWKYLNGLEMA
jgi:hypothetical protein